MTLIVLVLLVALLIVVLVALTVSLVMKRNAETNRAHAEQLRTEAATQAPGIQDSARAAEEADLQARAARAEAERADRRASEAQQSVQMDQARQEDAVRQADRIDPDVDHRADGYAPTTPSMGTPVAEPTTTDATATEPATQPTTTDAAPTDPGASHGNHRADGTPGTI